MLLGSVHRCLIYSLIPNADGDLRVFVIWLIHASSLNAKSFVVNDSTELPPFNPFELAGLCIAGTRIVMSYIAEGNN